MSLTRVTAGPSTGNPIPILPDFPNGPAAAAAVCDAAVAALATQNALEFGHVWNSTTYCFGVSCLVIGPFNGLLLLLDALAVPASGNIVSPNIVLAAKGISSNGDWGFADLQFQRPVGPFAQDVVAIFSTNMNPFIYTQPTSAAAFFTGQVI